MGFLNPFTTSIDPFRMTKLPCRTRFRNSILTRTVKITPTWSPFSPFFYSCLSLSLWSSSSRKFRIQTWDWNLRPGVLTVRGRWNRRDNSYRPSSTITTFDPLTTPTRTWLGPLSTTPVYNYISTTPVHSSTIVTSIYLYTNLGCTSNYHLYCPKSLLNLYPTLFFSPQVLLWLQQPDVLPLSNSSGVLLVQGLYE